jgi:hypothetical protein
MGENRLAIADEEGIERKVEEAPKAEAGFIDVGIFFCREKAQRTCGSADQGISQNEDTAVLGQIKRRFSGRLSIREIDRLKPAR